ncbi:hypothetical protein HPB51_012485 [Rhipicephalus microplus]|uniref:Amino acid transporter transmembrane domain-containing protein n=1 Tax=Rhipicephalus microplus TaxID=6941 RepID=A0A9J6E9U5_RHIMP|nr:hypothetical protein HPB51_012485 [Rhipicephalus microplus]
MQSQPLSDTTRTALEKLHILGSANGHAYAPPPDYGDTPSTILNTPSTPGFTTAPPIQEGDWWTQTKLWYRQQYKKADPVLPAVPASLGLAATAASLAGNLTGAGMVMIPFAFVWIGWSAIFWLPVFGVLTVFSAGLLESCCETLEERHEEYRRFHWYTQYSDIANRAVGPGLSKVVGALRLFCVVGLWAVLIVIVSATMVDFVALILPVPVPRGHLYCGFVVGCGVLFVLSSGYHGNLLPILARVLRFGCTLKNPRWCGVLNTPVAVVLMILLLTGIAGNKKMAAGTGEAMFTIKLFDLGSLIGDVSGLSKGVKDVTSALYFVSLGILVFNFAGVCEFTNIRRDMKAPPSFTKAAAFGVAGSTLALFIVGVTAYAVLYPFNGNVVLILNTRNVRIAAHFFTVTCMGQVSNLSDLILGEYDHVEDYGKRVAWRRARISAPLALCAGGIALALPYEGPLMGLVGSLALCPVAFLLPPVFYYKLCQGSEQWPQKSVTMAVHSTLTSSYFNVNAMMPDQTWPLSTRMKICLALAILCGLLVFIGGTVASIIQLVNEYGADEQSCFRGFCYDQKFALTPASLTLLDVFTSGGNVDPNWGKCSTKY